jgi:hypothetical protein
MAAEIDQNDLLLRQDEFYGEAITDIDRYRMQPFEFSLKRMQSKRWVVRVQFKKFEGFLVLA